MKKETQPNKFQDANSKSHEFATKEKALRESLEKSFSTQKGYQTRYIC